MVCPWLWSSWADEMETDIMYGVNRGIVKLLDWEEGGMMTTAKTAALRASFRQEVAVLLSLQWGIPSKNSTDTTTLPSSTCCIVVEYLLGDIKEVSLCKLEEETCLQSTENLLLDVNKNLKIADFDVACVEAQNPQDMTGEIGTLGTWHQSKCDVYSFGICLWRIYCCDLPYMNLGFTEVSFAIVCQNLRPKIPR
ncbi:unnamed protein product [Thlaspi arvense]|uniref:Protein kinase domain-containing protein n=1 Tax=Thlaspi arvense TaxID=13288 RepID=A0AAU9RT07_THLAR|nr:unnamed protein product [Thlaspi arvense]